MKNLSNLLRKIGLLVGVGIVLVCFASCKNFLNANDVKKEIEEMIEISNSQPVTYFVSVDKGSGEVTPSSVSVKKKVNFELVFKPEDDWNFICWEVIDAETGEVLPDVIKFENPQNPQTKGYVINPREKALIHPKCVHLPYVTSISPDTAAPANMPITITFNVPMEAPDVTPANSIFNFTNISITCYGENINDYFDAPVFNSDKTELLIVPKSDQVNGVALYNYIKYELQLGTAEIKVEFSDNIVVKTNEIEMPLQNKNFIVYYLQSVDKTKPQGSLFITRDSSITLDNANSLPSEKRFDKNFNLDNLTANSIRQNLCNGTLYIYGQFYDDPIGIKSIVVKENMLTDYNGVLQPNSPTQVSSEYKIDANNENLIFKTVNGYTYFILKHVLTIHYGNELNARPDGAVSVDVCVNDYCYNSSETQHYVVIRRNNCTKTYATKYETEDILPQEWTDYDTYMDSYLEHFKSMVLYANLNEITLYKNFNYTINDTEKEVRFFIEYTDINHKIVEKEIVPQLGPYTVTITRYNYTPSTSTYTHKLVCDLSDFKIWPESSIIIVFKDFLGNIVKQKIQDPTFISEGAYLTFPSEDGQYIPSVYEKDGDTVVDIYSYDEENMKLDKCSYLDCLLIRQNDNQIECIGQYTVQSLLNITALQEKPKPLSSGYTYRIMFHGITKKNSTFTINSDSVTKPQSVYVQDITLNDNIINKHNGSLTLSFKINDANNDGVPDVQDYDYLVVSRNDKVRIIPKDTTVFTENITLSDICNTTESYRTIKVWGSKDNIRSDITTKIIPILSDTNLQTTKNKYDYDAPYLLIRYRGNKIELLACDDWSGIDSGEVTFNDKTYTVTVPNSSSCISDPIEIPFWEYYPYPNSSKTISYTIQDKAGNIKQVENAHAGISLMDNNSIVTKEGVTDTLLLSYEKINNGRCYFCEYDNSKGCFPAVCEDVGDDSKGIVYHEPYTEIYGITNTQIQSTYSSYPQNTYLKVFLGQRDINTPYPSFLKTYSTIKCSNPLYYYYGTPGDMDNDYLLPNGSSKESFLIGSDKPVYVHTLVTSAPVSECSTWDSSEWEYFKEEYNEKILEFDSNSDPKVYLAPVNKIAEGKNYVVIAHYSNNNVKMSEIFTK